MDGLHTTGGSRLNQLGGMYISGKPLSVELRSRIITLSCLGLRQCDISRQLKVTHGCISKLLSTYQETGNMGPSQNTGRPRVITANIERKIDQYRREDPGAFCWELREHLLKDNVCTLDEVPSLSSISRLVKNKIIHEAVEKKELHAKHQMKKEKPLTSFSIANILNINNDNDKTQQPKEQEHTANHQIYSGGLGDSISNTPTLESRKLHPDEAHSRAQRRQRTKFNRIQSVELEREFHRNPYPGIQRRVELACKLAIDESRIQVWFANRRAKVRRRVASKVNQQPTNNLEDRVRIFPRKYGLLTPNQASLLPLI